MADKSRRRSNAPPPCLATVLENKKPTTTIGAANVVLANITLSLSRSAYRIRYLDNFFRLKIFFFPNF